MTKKEMFDFVDEKYAQIEKFSKAPYEKTIREFDNYLRENREEAINTAKEVLMKDLLHTGYYAEIDPEAIAINVLTYALKVEEPAYVKDARNQIREISKILEIEKQDFKDDLLLFGVKNPAIVDKLGALRDRVRKLMQEAEEA